MISEEHGLIKMMKAVRSSDQVRSVASDCRLDSLPEVQGWKSGAKGGGGFPLCGTLSSRDEYMKY